MKRKRIHTSQEDNLLCVNCSQKCVKLVDPDHPEDNSRVQKESYCVQDIVINLNEPDTQRIEKKSVKTALSLIFRLKVVNELNLDNEGGGGQKSAASKDDDSKIVLCIPCSELLQSLYILFDEFNHLRKAGSYLDKKIVQLDDLLTQLQETWTEMATMTEDDIKVDEKPAKKCDTIIPTHKHIVSQKNDDDDKEDDEVVICEEVVNENSRRSVNSKYTRNRERHISQQAISSIPSAASIYETSTLEQRIFDEIKAITGVPKSANIINNSTSILPDDHYNNDENHFENEMDFEDETEEGESYQNAIYSETGEIMAEAYWEDEGDDDEIIGLPHESDNSSSNFQYPSRTASTDDQMSALGHDDGTDDSDWRNTRTRVDKRKGKRKIRTPRLRRKPIIPFVESCTICPEPLSFDSPLERSEHFINHHADQKLNKTVRCLLCSKKFTGFFSLRTHLRGHSRYYPYVCSVQTCQRSFLTMQQLDQHVCITTQMDRNSGPSSSKKVILDGRKARRGPRSSNYKVETFTVCPLCPDKPSFEKPSDLSEHFWTTHRQPGDNNDCTLCQKRLSAPCALQTHMRAHSADLRFTCHICQKSFLTRMQQEKHTQTHGPGGNVAATQSTSGDWSPQDNEQQPRIIRRRMRGKQVQVYKYCPLCPEKPTFAYASDLSHHMWSIHVCSLKDKNKCPICNKKMSQVQYLRTHVRGHAGDRRYTCPVDDCSSSFLINQQLQLHIQRSHPDVANTLLGNNSSITSNNTQDESLNNLEEGEDESLNNVQEGENVNSLDGVLNCLKSEIMKNSKAWSNPSSSSAQGSSNIKMENID